MSNEYNSIYYIEIYDNHIIRLTHCIICKYKKIYTSINLITKNMGMSYTFLILLRSRIFHCKKDLFQ